MKNIIYLATALAAIAIPSASQAQCSDFCNINDCVTGYYTGIQAGPNWNHYHRNKHMKYCTNTGYLVSGAMGVKTVYNVRLEGEIAYRRNSLNHVKTTFGDSKNSKDSKYSGTASMRESISGHLSSLSFMANAIYDIQEVYGVNPYAGLGIGYSRNYQTARVFTDKEDGSGVRHKNGFAWQAIAGLAYPLEMLNCYGLNNVCATAEYRYFSPNINHYYDQSVSFGLRTDL